jgi:hypothetical protein
MFPYVVDVQNQYLSVDARINLNMLSKLFALLANSLT